MQRFNYGGNGLFEQTALEIEPIGIIHSCYTEKFGIPRQPGLVDKAHASLILSENYNRQEMVKELNQFSHIWVIFIFHATIKEGWKPTVRPPGLGGQVRVGVFASRSPHRPNHIGLSVVRLLEISLNNNRVTLELGGGDFLDKTPVIDIKPYISYCDSVEDASGGYSGLFNPDVDVIFTEKVEKFCSKYQKEKQRDLKGLISQTLTQDPRPASQRTREKKFGFRLWDVNVRWCAEDKGFLVFDCQKIQGVP